MKTSKSLQSSGRGALRQRYITAQVMASVCARLTHLSTWLKKPSLTSLIFVRTPAALAGTPPMLALDPDGTHVARSPAFGHASANKIKKIKTPLKCQPSPFQIYLKLTNILDSFPIFPPLHLLI
jgi:hypothetical protein